MNKLLFGIATAQLIHAMAQGVTGAPYYVQSVRSSQHPNAENDIRTLLRLKAAGVTSVVHILGARITVTNPTTEEFRYATVFNGGYSFYGFDLLAQFAESKHMPWRAGYLLNIVLAFENVFRANIAIIPELHHIRYADGDGDGLYRKPMIDPATPIYYVPQDADREVIKMFTHNYLSEVVIGGKLVYTHLHDLACMMLAMEYLCLANDCYGDYTDDLKAYLYVHHDHVRRALWRFDFDYVGLVGGDQEYGPGLTPDICEARARHFVTISALYAFLAKIVARGPVAGATFAELSEGLKKCSG